MGEENKVILEGILEGVSEMGPIIEKDYSHIAKGGEGTPIEVHKGNYSILKIKTEDGTTEQRYEGIVFPDSFGHHVEVLEQITTIKSHGPPPLQKVHIPKRVQVYDKDLDRLYS